MKRFRYLIIASICLVIIVLGYFILKEVNPMSASRYPFMLALLAVDIYLWFSVRKRLLKLKALTRWVLKVFFWLPLVIFIALTLVAFIADGKILPAPLISYLIGIVLVTYGAKILAVVFFLLNDILRILHFSIRFNHAKIKGKPFERGRKTMTRGKFIQNIGLAGGGLLLGGFLIGMIKWANDFRVRHVHLSFPNLPQKFNGLKVVQISDLHLGSWASTEPIREVAEMIADLNPDMVLFTGDLVNFSTREAYRFKSILRDIKARHGVYAILGNHDYGDYMTWPDEQSKQENMDALYRFYDEIGWKLLRNEHHIISRGDSAMAILGVENWSSSPRFPTYGNLEKTLQGTDEIPFRLLMSHDPTHWENQVSQSHPEIDLTLSGHTHGFQFGVEFRNFKWSLAQYMYKYWAGLYSIAHPHKEQYLYVNRGLGMVGYPGRVGILPEITMITLES